MGSFDEWLGVVLSKVLDEGVSLGVKEIEQKFIHHLYHPLKKFGMSPTICTGIDVGKGGMDNLLEISTFGVVRDVGDVSVYEREMLSYLEPFYIEFGELVGYDLVLFKIGKDRFSGVKHLKVDASGDASFYLYAAFMRKMDEYKPVGKLYHVTWLDNVADILSNGLNISLSDMKKNYFFTDLKSAREHIEVLYIHPMYQKSRRSGDVAILEVDPGKLRDVTFSRDPEDTIDLTSVMTRSNISPEAISLVEKYPEDDL